MDECMQVSVKIMGIDIDMMSNDIFIQKMNEYLTEDSLDVILFASTDMLNRAVDDLEYQQILKQAKLLLPGEEALLTTHHVDILEAGGMVVSCRSLGMMLENLIKEDRTLYIIAESEEEVAGLQEYCRHMHGNYSRIKGWDDRSDCDRSCTSQQRRERKACYRGAKRYYRSGDIAFSGNQRIDSERVSDLAAVD